MKSNIEVSKVQEITMPVQKAKRGRPRFDDNLIKMYHDMWPGVRTRRGFQNLHYSTVAFGVLKDLDGMDFFWITDEKGERISMKTSILTELGRLKDPELIEAIAESLCKEQKEHRRTVKEWIQILRTLRLSKYDLRNGFLK